MRAEHERYEKLAVGHVLGGLDVDESADFRSHLLGCRECRMRVAELRDLAADLDAAERDERARAQLRTEVVRRDESEEDRAAAPRIGVRHVSIAAVVVIVLAGVMAFWNLHLRTAAAGYAEAAAYRSDTLRELSEGIPVVVEAAEGVRALVVTDQAQVAFTVSGLPAIADGERLEVWLLTGDVAARAGPPVPARHLEDRALAGAVDLDGADTLVVTLEAGPLRDSPGATELVRAALDAPA